MNRNLARSTASAISIDRGTARGRATRELLICTAERLFAERGINAVSLREIGVEAGQRNNAATEYHFGTRENLLAAIYVFRARALNERCLELLTELTDEARLDDVGALLRALVVPHAENIQDRNDHFLGFLARALTEEARLNVASASALKPNLDAIMLIRAHIRQCLPDLSDERFERRMTMVGNWAVHALAEYSRDHPGATANELDAMLDELIAMLEGALKAGSSDYQKPMASSS
jgi:AcrR family transcriptional regulator